MGPYPPLAALGFINLAVLAIAHLAGVVVAVILLIKYKGTPAILATVAFGLSFIQDLVALLRTVFLNTAIMSAVGDFETAILANGILDCCCNILSVIGLVCLILAIWQAVAGKRKETV